MYKSCVFTILDRDWVMVGPILRAPAVTAHNVESDPAHGGWSDVRVDREFG